MNIPAGWHIDHDGSGDETLWDADDQRLLARWMAPDVFDVIAEAIADRPAP